MTFAKKCVICGAGFEAAARNAKLCGQRKCARKRSADNMRALRQKRGHIRLDERPKRVCVICNAVFQAKTDSQKTCSKVCSRGLHNLAVIRHRQKDPKAYRAKQNAYRRANRERFREIERRYKQKHPEKIRAQNRKAHEKRSAQVRLVRELQRDGLEALL